MPTRFLVMMVCCLLLPLSGCDKIGSMASNEPEHIMADTIYIGTVITLDDMQPQVEAVAVADGRIVAVGNRATVMKHKAATTTVRELGEAVMLPGFVDAHSQFMKAVELAGTDTRTAIKAVQMDYARHGYTTISSGTTSWRDYQHLQQAAQDNALFLDVVALADVNDFAAFDKVQADWRSVHYDRHLRIAGVKLVIDGAPQDKMAYLSLPLLLADGPNGEKHWRGQSRYTPEELDKTVAVLVQKGAPLFAEAHGDAAIDMVIGSLNIHRVNDDMDRRDTVVHAQFLRPGDQVSLFKSAGAVPSFCTNHIYTSGDAYVETVGGKRAEEVSPIKSAYYIKASNHSDYPDASLNPMMVVWTAVNRMTESGRVLQEWQRLDVETALRAITTDAAWQYHEENTKGSIATGKLADFVVLDQNPLTSEPMALKDIRVMETIKEGTTVFTAG